MSLEVNIRKRLSRFTLNVEFETGEGVLALLGASGCGKSITLKCIAGIERPDEGRIILDGRALFDSRKKIDLPPQKRRVGYMFQDYALFPNMTVRQNVIAGMGRKPDREAADEILERFRISEIASQYPATLSGGQKQRTAMARLVAQSPDAVLLDEPFSALDASLRSELEHEMRAVLAALGRPAVFVSHNRDEVYRLCTEVSCMQAGIAERAEPVREFFSDPKTRYAAVLSGCKNVAAARVLDLHHLEVPEWGIVLCIRREIPPDTAYVGIRAHDLRAQYEASCDNRIHVAEGSALEDLFEWTCLCRTSERAAPLQWKIAKEVRPEVRIPEHLYLDSDRVMLLR